MQMKMRTFEDEIGRCVTFALAKVILPFFLFLVKWAFFRFTVVSWSKTTFSVSPFLAARSSRRTLRILQIIDKWQSGYITAGDNSYYHHYVVLIAVIIITYELTEKRGGERIT